MYPLNNKVSYTVVNYVVVSEELQVLVYMPYLAYNDLLCYYDIQNPLHSHEIVKDHLTLAVI